MRLAPGPAPSLLSRLPALFVVVVLVVYVWLDSVRSAQLSAHVITTSIGSQVLSQIVVTNPVYVSYETDSRVGSNGFELYQKATTNVYWHVWSVFKK